MIDNLKIGEVIVFLIGAGFVAFVLSIVTNYGKSIVHKWQWEKNGSDRRKNYFSNGSNDLFVNEKIKYLEKDLSEKSDKYIPIIEDHGIRIITLEIQYKTIIEMLTEIKHALKKNESL